MKKDLPRSGFAVASIILGVLAFIPILGLLLGTLAIIFGALALMHVKTAKVKGTGLAVAGMILGFFGILFTIFLYILMMSLLLNGMHTFSDRMNEGMSTEQIMQQNQAQLENYRQEHGSYPEQLNEVENAISRDQNGEIQYTAYLGGRGYELRSAGSDERLNTDDDVVVRK